VSSDPVKRSATAPDATRRPMTPPIDLLRADLQPDH
jgi:hypothetical protein